MGFTIHDIEPNLDKRLSEIAREKGTSKNRLVKDLLARALGMPSEANAAHAYREFCGVWTAAEKAEFDSRQSDNSAVSEEDWR